MTQTNAYKKLSYLTVQDLYDAMQYRPRPAADQITTNNHSPPELNRIIAYLENTYFDMETNSPEYFKMVP